MCRHVHQWGPPTNMAFEWLLDTIDKVVLLSQQLRLPIYIDRFPPVPEPVIDAWEQVLGMPLSPSYRDFFRITNGLTIDFRYVMSEGPSNFCLLGSQIWILQIEHLYNAREYNKNNQDNTSENVLEHWEDMLVCAIIDGSGNEIVLDPRQASPNGEYVVCFANHEDWPGNWRQGYHLADSFEGWVKAMFDAMLERHIIPEYWRGEYFMAPDGVELLLPHGAEQYDWTCTSEVVEGRAIYEEPERHFPQASLQYDMGVVEGMYKKPTPVSRPEIRVHAYFYPPNQETIE